MKKLALAGITGILATIGLMGITGCGQQNAVDDTKPEDSMKEEAAMEETMPATKIVDTNDYKYDSNKGAIVAVKNGEVLYTAEHPDTETLYILGLDGNKLIMWKTVIDNSPGPCWTVWSAEDEAENVLYLDLDDLEAGLTVYEIPEYKVDEGEQFIDTCMKEIFGEETDMEEPYVYNNMKYGFQLTFPAGWGKVKASENGEGNITITSEDGEKKMNLNAISNDKTGDEGVVDAPLKLVGVGYEYSIYREGDFGLDILEAQGEDVSAERTLEDELKNISATFRILDKDGNAVTEGGGGVAPDESPENYPKAPSE